MATHPHPPLPVIPQPALAPRSVVVSPHTSLYVGDIHYSVTDSQLSEFFSDLPNFISARICTDVYSKQSLGYGYVNFTTPDDANRAIEVRNHTLLNGIPIRVMKCNRDPEGRMNGIGNVFVKNLSESIDNVRLQEMFSKFGNVLSCKVATSADGKSKGHGYVQFELEESATAAITNLNDSEVDGKQLYVSPFVKKSDRIVPGADAKFTNLYMKNLDQDITEEFLKNKFSEFGKIANLVIAKDDYGNSKGFGFVNFENPDNAKQAMEAMNGTQLGSKALYVARAQKRAERNEILRRQYEERRKEQIQKYKGSNVYVKNIEDGVDDDELREHFSQCGTITSVKIMRDDKGIRKGFGFVCFSTPEEANKAVSTFHGKMFHRKPLYVAIAQRKEERQAQLRLQFGQRMGLPGLSAPVIPAGYPHLYYTPPGIVPQMPPRQGLMYPPLGIRPGWRGNGFLPPTGPRFQPMPLPVTGSPRHHRQNRGRINGHMFTQGGVQSLPFRPYFPQPIPAVNSPKDSSNLQRPSQPKYVPNGRQKEMNNGSAVPSGGAHNNSSRRGLDMLSSMLSAASPHDQKQMLGEHLYPLVHNIENELAAKITGMLLEMDNSELLLLLESPDSLAAKVGEAVKVLKLTKTKVTSSKEGLHSNNFLSTEVAVN